MTENDGGCIVKGINWDAETGVPLPETVKRLGIDRLTEGEL